jgi:hypothetical protein
MGRIAPTDKHVLSKAGGRERAGCENPFFDSLLFRQRAKVGSTAFVVKKRWIIGK